MKKLNIIPNIKSFKLKNEDKEYTFSHINFYSFKDEFDLEFYKKTKKLFLELSNFWEARWVEKKMIRDGEEISLEIVINYKNFKNNEEYFIDFKNKKINIYVRDFSGLSNSLSTIYQMQINNEFFIDSEISDYPSFRWRGTLIDTSRHYFNPTEIKKIIFIQWLYKQNILHWHISDDQGWRLSLDSLPDLAERSSFRYKKSINRGTYGGYFRKCEIKDIIEYAGIFNIEILPEIDLPGHCQTLLFAYPELICENKKVKHIRKENGISNDVLCLGNGMVDDLIKKIINEVCEIFPFEYIHLGGDEAPTRNWEECLRCQNYMKKNKITNILELQSNFMTKWTKYLKKMNKKVIFYDDMFGVKGIKDVTMNFWRDNTIYNYQNIGIENIIEHYAKLSIPIILSPNKYTYFDHGYSANSWKKGITGNWINTLENAYKYSLSSFVNKDLLKKIIGSECSLWSEEIRNFDELSEMWIPRMLAFQEEVWGGKTSFIDFKERVINHQDLFKNLNIKVNIKNL